MINIKCRNKNEFLIVCSFVFARMLARELHQKFQPFSNIFPLFKQIKKKLGWKVSSTTIVLFAEISYGRVGMRF